MTAISEAVAMDRWNHTAKICQTLINLKVSRKDQVRLKDVHPLLYRPESWELLKSQVIGNGNGIRPKH